MAEDIFREMSARQYVLALKQLGLGHAGAAKMLGMTDKMSRNYGHGDYPVPQAEAALLRMLIKHEGPESPLITQWRTRPAGRPPES